MSAKPRLATVYRTLDFLTAEGLIRRVSTTGGIGRYDAKLEPHLHLVCRVCDGIADLGGLSAVEKGLKPSLPGSFKAESIDVRVVGVCRDCRATPAGTKSSVLKSQPRAGGCARHSKE